MTAILAATVVGEPLALRHWIAIATMVVGLVLVVVAAGPVGSTHFETERTLMLYLGSAVTLVLGLLAARWHGPAQRRRSSGPSPASRTAAPRSRPGPWSTPTSTPRRSLPALTVVSYGLLGFWLCSLGLRRAAVTAVNAPLILLETLIPAIIGITVFDDEVRAGWWPVAVIGFALSTAGALVLCGAEARLEDLDGPQLEQEPMVGWDA